MIFDKLIESIVKVPKFTNLVNTSPNEKISSLYKKVYALKVAQRRLKDTYKSTNDMTFSIIENIANNLSEDQKKIGMSEKTIVKSDNPLKYLKEQKEKLASKVGSEEKELNSELKNVSIEIENCLQQIIHTPEFQLDIYIGKGHLKRSHLFFGSIKPEHRMPIHYLFNEEIPSVDLTDKNLLANLVSSFPKECQEILTPEELKEGFHQRYRDFSFQYFGEFITPHPKIPLFQIDKTGVFSVHLAPEDKVNTGIYSYFLDVFYEDEFNPNYLPVLYDYTACNKDDYNYNLLKKNKSNLNKYSGSNDVYGNDKVIEAASKILSVFYKNGLANKIRVHENYMETNL